MQLLFSLVHTLRARTRATRSVLSDEGKSVATRKNGLFGLQATSYKLQAGFTLIEMIVVTGIIVILTGVLLVKNSSFGGSIILKSLAYDIALSVREAQTYGISVRQSTGGNYTSGYGVEVRIASPTSYLLYVDSDDSGYYTGSTELVTRYSLKQGYAITGICYTAAGAVSEVCGAQKLDVTFKRPEPDAYIRVNDTMALNQRARIKLSSPGGNEVSIYIEATGQISVK